MIKPINVSPLNTTKEVYIKCPKCKFEATVTLENSIINTENEFEMSKLNDWECPECQVTLGEVS